MLVTIYYYFVAKKTDLTEIRKRTSSQSSKIFSSDRMIFNELGFSFTLYNQVFTQEIKHLKAPLMWTNGLRDEFPVD